MKADDRPAVTFEPFDGFTKTQNHRKIESFCSYSELKGKLLKSYNLRPNIASRLTVVGSRSFIIWGKAFVCFPEMDDGVSLSTSTPLQGVESGLSKALPVIHIL